MLKIDCPWCGPRAEVEFCCGGESHIQRPEPFDKVTDAEWASYLFYRQNPKGLHFERWVHKHGCRQWFNVARDTVTHEIKSVYLMADPKPDVQKLTPTGKQKETNK
ncbi:sarcosine oxidase subunit delta [Kordiimonas pumila]|uniref:Sarcosine oxidase subunit delta n=1 Tax=Kordiimonas pumila TaxID=2161677 RepID=A0ABV7D9E5_9PROT|nr:sarcosine oxidase subunit delta [Kordiimonas pumila]